MSEMKNGEERCRGVRAWMFLAEAFWGVMERGGREAR